MHALHIGEDGIYGETNGEISSYTAVKTGISLVNAGKILPSDTNPTAKAHIVSQLLFVQVLPLRVKCNSLVNV